MNCEAYEIAIEQHHRGVLGVQSVPDLTLHVDSCRSCQSFTNLIRYTEKTMQVFAATTIDSLDWAAISKGLHKWRRDLTIGFWRLVVVGLLSLALGLLMGSIDSDNGPFTYIVPGAGAAAAVFFLSQRERRRLLAELGEAEESQRELLAVYRRQLDSQIKTTKQNSWVLPLVACSVVFLLPQEPSSTNYMALGALICSFAALGAKEYFLTLPQLIRSRLELG